MVEIIDRKTGTKMMAKILLKVHYDLQDYVFYSVKRSNTDANIFVSKLVRNSQGLTLDHQFSNGEKEVLEGIMKRFLNMEPVIKLEDDGIDFSFSVFLGELNYFDIDLCYVATMNISLIKKCLLFYGIVTEDDLIKPVVEVRETTKKFNEGFAGNLFLIIFGIVLLIFGVGVIIEVLF